MAKRLNLTEEQLAELRERYEVKNESLQKLATELECSVPTVARNLRKGGATIRPRGRPLGSINGEGAPRPLAVGVPAPTPTPEPEPLDTPLPPIKMGEEPEDLCHDLTEIGEPPPKTGYNW